MYPIFGLFFDDDFGVFSGVAGGRGVRGVRGGGGGGGGTSW